MHQELERLAVATPTGWLCLKTSGLLLRLGRKEVVSHYRW
jgi:hypothetical protein